MDGSVDFDLLAVGFESHDFDLLLPHLKNYKTKSVKTLEEISEVINNFNLTSGVSVLISTSIAGAGYLEIAQSFSSTFTGLNLFFVTWDRSKLDHTTLKKNGYTDVFYLPMDQQNLLNQVYKNTNTSDNKVTKKFKSVKLVDIDENESLPFEVRTYLSFNKKYVIINASGKVSTDKITSLKSNKIASVYIDAKQVERFYQHTTDKLIKLGSDNTISETERTARIQTAVSHLFKSILDASKTSATFESGNELAEQSKKVVELYIQTKIGVNISDKIKSLLGEGNDAYTHAQTVSTMACLLSMATQIGSPEELAIAGLFHDIGIEGVSDEINIFNYNQLPADQKQKYIQHPTFSLNILKEKRISISQKIADVIEKHHERIDGKGFPKQILEHRIPAEANLLAYADALEYLTRKDSAFGKMSLAQIHSKIDKELALHPEVLKKIGDFLLNASL